MLTGMIADVLVARQRMVGCFPLVLMFDVGEDSEELDKIGRCACVCVRVCVCASVRVRVCACVSVLKYTIGVSTVWLMHYI